MVDIGVAKLIWCQREHDASAPLLPSLLGWGMTEDAAQLPQLPAAPKEDGGVMVPYHAVMPFEFDNSGGKQCGSRVTLFSLSPLLHPLWV